jgi:hypothetical protein
MAIDYLHRIFGIYAAREDAEVTRQHLLEAGFLPEQLEILDRPGHPEAVEANSDEVRNDTIIGGTLGSLAGGALGVLGEAALAAANVSLFVASPIIGTLTMIGWGAAAGGVIGALAGAGRPETHHFADLVDEALRQGYWVLIVHARTEAQTTMAQAELGGALQAIPASG